jgi:hypothetical protein
MLNSSYISSNSKLVHPVVAKGFDSLNNQIILGTSGAIDSDDDESEERNSED